MKDSKMNRVYQDQECKRIAIVFFHKISVSTDGYFMELFLC
jgi:hypothetical protein